MPRRNNKARRKSRGRPVRVNIPTGPAPTTDQMAGDLVARGLASPSILSSKPAPRGPARDATSGRITRTHQE